MNRSTVIHSFKKRIDMLVRPATISDQVLYTHFDIGEFHKPKYKPAKARKNFLGTGDKAREFLLTLFLNDVDGGGHVIFPLMNISISPQKGNAIMWDFEPGQKDKYFVHTICPIYTGNCTAV